MSENEKILYEARKNANDEVQRKERERIWALNTQDAIYFNFSYTALKMLGKNLYNNPLSAISELVANSIDAKAENVYVYINMIDKEHSTVEVIDDGCGMSYKDLAEKYVWIGRNKRDEATLTTKDKEMLMGRKGIGKLAALYLSNKYYIFSKKDGEESKWLLNVLAYKDSDFPKIDKIHTGKKIDNQVIWDKNIQGTAIILDNVDLRRTGNRRIEGLRRNLSDFYLIDAIGTKIWVAVKDKESQKISYDLVKKNVAYKNFYAVFDNSEYKVSEKIRDSIPFTWLSTYKDIAQEERPTFILKPESFVTKGTGFFQKEDGELVEKEYQLKGWIAIHSTIEMKDAVDDKFIRNDMYQPNKLRLYVRNKLAVNNYFEIKPSTQAMSNYIEGEISFDILDDDDLPDIATSSRQDFLDDERVTKLITLVDPIISALFKLRIKVGQQIRNENNQRDLELKEEERRKREAIEAQVVQERKAKEAAQKDAAAAHKQSYFLQSQLSGDAKARAYNTHVIKNNAERINGNILSLLNGHPECKAYTEVRSISLASNKITTAVKYYDSVHYDLMNKKLEGNITEFIGQYIQGVVKNEYHDMHIEIGDTVDCMFNFPPQDLTVAIENVFSNAYKANAKVVNILFKKESNQIRMLFVNDGEKLPEGINRQHLFEFGYSNCVTSKASIGTGIGLYQIKDLFVRKLNGKVDIYDNNERGITLEVQLYEGGI